MHSKVKSAPFRADHVGSFLRPQPLREARVKFAEGKISTEELRKVEDTEILKLIEKEKLAGIKGITDGEFRRASWHLDFIEHLNGIEGYIPEDGYNQNFKGAKIAAYNIRVVGKISFPRNHPFLAHFSFLKNAVGDSSNHIAKATIPSPTMILRQEVLANKGHSLLSGIYPNIKDFYKDLSTVYSQAIMAFYEAGCRYLQFDDTNWAFLIDKDKRTSLQQRGIHPDEVASLCTQIINDALAVKPADMIITTHICRGNHASSWIFSGGYEAVAKPLFATNYDGYFLEYDSDRSGDFTPLREWRPNSGKVVLGLITSKFSEMENATVVKERIREASKYVPLDYLCLSPQCGFSSTEVGNKLTEEQQWEKMKNIVSIAKEVWSE